MLTGRWQAISARIDGLARAAEAIVEPDPYSVRKRLGPIAEDTYKEIEIFISDYADSITFEGKSVFENFRVSHGSLFEEARTSKEIASAIIPLLVVLRSELEFALSDYQERIRSITERAFLHLRRVLVANPREREVWLAAFNEDETRCEKLGATHLLSHGIFAFKAHADGARTDLVLGESIKIGEVAPAVEGLVLTEWNRATSGRDIEEKFREARRQADRYAQGALAGIELAGYRYLVVVSEKSPPSTVVPEDLKVGRVTYRHINIPIDTDSPSKEARRR
ncbi:MAG: hypothetical protein IOD05_09585 [Rhodobacter sp.]|nr:hypothetical protein [Rhodobacter sp.]